MTLILEQRAAAGTHRPRRPSESSVGTIGPIGAREGGTTGLRGGTTGIADRTLAARLALGDPAALAEAYRTHGGLVHGICRRVLRDSALAEDVTQEVFTHLWERPERFDPSRGTLETWLGLLAHRRSVDRVRAESRRARIESRVDVAEPVGTETEDYLTVVWMSTRVREALDLLPEEQRQVVVLAYYGERSYREVAKELGLPEGTVKSRVRLALRKLDALLREELCEQDRPAWT